MNLLVGYLLVPRLILVYDIHSKRAVEKFLKESSTENYYIYIYIIFIFRRNLCALGELITT